MDRLKILLLNQNNEEYSKGGKSDPLTAILNTFKSNPLNYNSTIERVKQEFHTKGYTITNINQFNPTTVNNLQISPTVIIYRSSTIKINEKNVDNNNQQKLLYIKLNQVLDFLNSKTLFASSIVNIVDLLPQGKGIHSVVNGFKFLFVDIDDPNNSNYLSLSNKLLDSLVDGGNKNSSCGGNGDVSYKSFPLARFDSIIKQLEKDNYYNSSPPSTIYESIVIVLTSICTPFLNVNRIPHQAGIELICALFIEFIINTNVNGTVEQFISSLSNITLPEWSINLLKFIFTHQVINVNYTPAPTKIPFFPPKDTTHTFVLSAQNSVNIGRIYTPIPSFPSSGKIVDKTGSKVVGEILAIYDTRDLTIDSKFGSWLLFTHLYDDKSIDHIELLKSNILPSFEIVKNYSIYDISEWVNTFINQKGVISIIGKNGHWYFDRGCTTINKATDNSKRISKENIEKAKSARNLIDKNSTATKTPIRSSKNQNSNITSEPIDVNVDAGEYENATTTKQSSSKKRKSNIKSNQLKKILYPEENQLNMIVKENQRN